VAAVSHPADTSSEALDELSRIWRLRAPHDRWALLASLDADVEAIARAGILWANPAFTEAQVDRELFRRRYGDRLTSEVFGTAHSH
jgi:hypothetical protein